MNAPLVPGRCKRARRTRTLVPVLFASACALLLTHSAAMVVQQPRLVFEVEFPEFGLAPTSQPDFTIPSANVREVVVHILNPVAEDVDYSGIRHSINGNFTSILAETYAGKRGKLVKIDLMRIPDYQFVTGRNTVEVWAETRRGRLFYASFVVRTVTQNRNEGLSYRVEHAEKSKGGVPPELVLLDPERAIVLPKSRATLPVKISGVATAADSVKRVLVNGQAVALSRKPEIAMRGLGLANESKQVFFQTNLIIRTGMNEVVVAAEDSSGTRTLVSIPVIRGGAEPATSFKGRKYALIIGISKFNDRAIPNLNFADVDARAIQQFLQLSAGGNFSPDDVRVMVNEQATFANIQDAFTSFIAKPTADDLLLIFLAGHGAPDYSAPQNLYVLAHDTSIENMSRTALAMPDLKRYIENNVRARRVVLLIDTCHSAGLSTEVTRAVGNNIVNLYFERFLYKEEGRAIITSSDVNEYSRESEKWGNGHGVFTFYLLEGLKGKADVNEDRLVSLGELFRFVRQKVRLDTQFQQNPRMLVGENENVALAYVVTPRR